MENEATLNLGLKFRTQRDKDGIDSFRCKPWCLQGSGELGLRFASVRG